MKATIRGQSTEIRVTSIILENDPDEPEKMSMFSCPVCGKSLFQHGGNIIMIVPGGSPTQIPVVIECRICKHRYLIVSAVDAPDPSLILS